MSDTNRLLDLYVPPEGFVLESLVATTFRIDFAFVEEELLPVALGVKAPVSRMRAFRSELERRLAACDVTFLYDLRGCDRLARLSRRIDPLPVAGRKLHSKIALLLWTRTESKGTAAPEKRLRLIVGSANLTREGFRENYEVVTALDFGGRSQAPRELLERALAQVESLAAEAPSPQLAGQVAGMRLLLPQFPPGTVNVDAPRTFVDAAGVLPALEEAWRSTSPTRPERVVIVSPFWPAGEEAEAPVAELLRRLGGAGKLELVCEGAPTPDGKARLPVLPPALTGRLREQVGCPLLLRPVRPDLGLGGPATPDDGDRNEDDELGSRSADADVPQRGLHAKMIVLQGKEGIVLYAGSSNCTRRGLALGAAPNWEAGFVYSLGKKQTAAIDKLLAFAGPAVEVLPSEDVPTQTPEYEPEVPLPVFLHEVLAEGSRVTIRFRSGAPVPPDLVVLMRDVTVADPECYWLLLRGNHPQEAENSLIVSLESCPHCNANLEPVQPGTAGERATIVPHVEVEARWAGNVACFPVRFDDKTALPPVLLGRRPTEAELIDYFLLGREPGGDGTAGDASEVDAPNGDDPVDTRRILTYFIRRFVQAIPGLEAELDRAAYSRPSLQAALFGPTSPVALAQQAFESLSRSPRQDEPRKTPVAVGFQLVEITAALLRCRGRAIEGELRGLYDQAVDRCRTWLDTLAAEKPDLTAGPFTTYRRTFTE